MKCPHMTPFLQSIQEWDWKFHTSYTWFYECEVKKKDECSIRRENDHWSLVSMQEVIQHDLTLTFIFAELLSAHISSIQHYQPNYTSHVSCDPNTYGGITPQNRTSYQAKQNALLFNQFAQVNVNLVQHFEWRNQLFLISDRDLSTKRNSSRCITKFHYQLQLSQPLVELVHIVKQQTCFL